ncbi:hypothetical protein B0A52_07061 [Exophiala mesophila]|uniref:Tachykinin family protein n=1 Tax=Exophiala mesophila TaxID=212818 RepID=A0A438MZJ4_EXOME|nr:hypothetical protein B0A52_07061 [Exophiala mesophila]
MLLPDGQEKANDSQTQLPVAGPSTSGNFTFVNQADDLVSLTHRKISNTEQRHAIRSHVMQRVRKEELAQGKKRPTGREFPKRTTSTQVIKSPTERSDLAIKDEPVIKEEPSDQMALLPPARRLSESTTVKPSPIRRISIHSSPAVHEFDPFQSLPSGRVSHKALERLLTYCFDTLLPMTFSVEAQSHPQKLARQGMVLQSKISSPPVFLGFMATVAAHRAILHGLHKDLAPSSVNHDDLITDPDYKRVKHEAIVAVRNAVQTRAKVDQYLLEACFGLVSTATVVGNFQEAKIHLQGVASMLASNPELSGIQEWVPITNVKIATAMLCQPCLTIPWDRQDMPQDLLDKIFPNHSADPHRLNSAFTHVEGLSNKLRQLLLLHQDLFSLCDYVAIHPRRLTAVENRILNRKAIELEYDYVNYVYDTSKIYKCRSSSSTQAHAHPTIPPLEDVIRLAGLGLCSIIPHTILPSSGSGRASTQHQKQAIERWRRERRHPGVNEMSAVVWALFIFVQRSLHQPEQQFFASLLRRMTHDLWLLTWEDVEATVAGYLYVPRIQAKLWRGVWDESI